MATIQEIAQQLGLSTATVSRALNDQAGVGKATRERVLQLAHALNYAPSSAARGLVTAQTHTIAFLTAKRSLPLPADPFYQRLMMGVEQELARHGYYLLVSTLDDTQLNDGASLRLLRENRVDGLILAGPEIPPRFILPMQAQKLPLVLVDNLLPQTALNAVLSDDEQGGYTATKHLIEHGHRQIAVLSGPPQWPSNQARSNGYRRAMQERQLPIAVYHQPETTTQTGYAAMSEALQQQPTLTAIFAINDSMAVGALRACREQGRRIPGEIAVVGFDDVEWAAHHDPALTTVKVFTYQIGALAAQRLLTLLHSGDESAPVISTVATRLVVRASCGCNNL